MEINNIPQSFISVLDNTFESGMASWYMDKKLAENIKKMPIEERFNAILGESLLFINHPSFLTTEYLRNLDIQFIPEKKYPQLVSCSMHAPTYFGLSKENFVDNLYALEEFFNFVRQSQKDFYENFPTCIEPISFNVANFENSPHKCVTLISLEVMSPPDQDKFLSKKTNEIQKKIEDSSVLTSWINHYLKVLNLTDKTAWSNVPVDLWFDQGENPLKKNIQYVYDLANPKQKRKVIIQNK